MHADADVITKYNTYHSVTQHFVYALDNMFFTRKCMHVKVITNQT